ncbi:hypothetical protein [Paenibacillus faecalis]|uniref:hypothetical protein n=1 Tax=Paenibacillus faecalis TaxID=2079532 RepID=UPI000D10E3D9|nr:hypothetical protein [Paenibacillus faecalis]
MNSENNLKEEIQELNQRINKMEKEYKKSSKVFKWLKLTIGFILFVWLLLFLIGIIQFVS